MSAYICNACDEEMDTLAEWETHKTFCSKLQLRMEDSARLASLAAQVAALTAERDALQRHYDAAAPEHNLLALLDMYYDDRHKAQAERDEALRELAEWQAACK